jgi:hypothetical protein
MIMNSEESQYEEARLDVLKRIRAVALESVKKTGHFLTGDISKKNNADIFLIISLGRLVNLLDGMIVLLANGLVYEAQIIARTVFELVCQALITYDDPAFLDEIENHDLVMERRSLELWLGKKPHLLTPMMNDERRVQEEQKLESLKKEIKKRGANLISKESLALRAGLIPLYIRFYDNCCDISHISLKHIRSCVISDKHNIPRGVFYGRNHHPNESDNVVRTIDWLTNDFLIKISKRFCLNIQKEVSRISENLREIPSPTPSRFIEYK